MHIRVYVCNFLILYILIIYFIPTCASVIQHFNFVSD